MELIQVNDARSLVTWWTLRGCITSERLEDIKASLSFETPELPVISTRVALQRALSELQTERIILRAKKANNTFALVRESWDGRKVQHEPVVTVSFTETDDEVELDVDIASDFHDYDEELITSMFTQLASVYQTTDVSEWLLEVADSLQAVRLRETGGIYFIQEKYAEQWRELIKAFSTTAHKIHELPVATTDSAIEAVTSALTREVEQALAAAERVAEVKGARAIATQRNLIERLSHRVSEFEAAFNRSLGNLQEQIQRVDAACVVATLRAENAE